MRDIDNEPYRVHFDEDRAWLFCHSKVGCVRTALARAITSCAISDRYTRGSKWEKELYCIAEAGKREEADAVEDNRAVPGSGIFVLVVGKIFACAALVPVRCEYHRHAKSSRLPHGPDSICDVRVYRDFE